jgi:hypothetical protein
VGVKVSSTRGAERQLACVRVRTGAAPKLPQHKNAAPKLADEAKLRIIHFFGLSTDFIISRLHTIHFIIICRVINVLISEILLTIQKCN